MSLKTAAAASGGEAEKSTKMCESDTEELKVEDEDDAQDEKGIAAEGTKESGVTGFGGGEGKAENADESK